MKAYQQFLFKNNSPYIGKNIKKSLGCTINGAASPESQDESQLHPGEQFYRDNQQFLKTISIFQNKLTTDFDKY